jgi:hypothetical protein
LNMRPGTPRRLFLKAACFLPLLAVPLLVNSLLSELASGVGLRGVNRIVDAAAGAPLWLEPNELRALKTASLLRLERPVDILIFGSSRSSTISPEWLAPASAFNASVLLGDLRDFVAFSQILHQTGKMPRAVVLTLGPTLLVEPHQLGEVVLAPYFLRALARYRLDPPLPSVAPLYGELIANVLPAPVPEWSTAPLPGRAMLLFPRGELWGPHDLHPHAPGDWSPDVLRADTWRSQLEPSEFATTLLTRFLDDLQSRGVRVIFLLIPPPPLTYEFYSARGGYNDSFLRHAAAARGVQLIGSFRPSNVGASAADFVDEIHPRPALLYRLLHDAGLATAPYSPRRPLPQ